MEEWVGFYERVFGMTEMIHFSDEAISTEYSALMSKVVTDGSGRLKFPINEPAEGKRKSQIEEYLDFYRGRRRAAHRAVATRDIVGTVAELRGRGVEFLPIPERLLRRGARARRRDRAGHSRDLRRAGHPRRPRRRGLPAPDLHQAGRRPAHGLLRDHRAPRLARLRRGQLQGPVRGDRARAGRSGATSDAVRQPRRASRQAPRPVRGATARPPARPRRSWASRASPATSRSSTTSIRPAGSRRSASSRRSSARSGCRTRTSTGSPTPTRVEPGGDALSGRRAAAVERRHRGVDLQADRASTTASTATARATRCSSSTTAAACVRDDLRRACPTARTTTS